MASDKDIEQKAFQMEIAIAQTREITKLTERCWNHCSLKVTDKLDARSETCFVNCIDRFIESSQIILSAFQTDMAGNLQ